MKSENAVAHVGKQDIPNDTEGVALGLEARPGGWQHSGRHIDTMGRNRNANDGCRERETQPLGHRAVEGLGHCEFDP